MNFETVATLDDQTFLITPRNSGQVVRFGGVETVTTALVEVRAYGTGPVELSEGQWDSRERVRTRHLRVDCDLRTVAA